MPKPPAVIKGSNSATQSLKLRGFNFTDVAAEARATLAQAKSQAAAIVEQARATVAAEAARTCGQAAEQGYAEGHQKGLEAGRRAGREEAFEAATKEFTEGQAALVRAFSTAVASIEEGRRAWQSAAHNDLVELAMAIARRVAHHVGRTHREAVLANLEQAVRIVGARTEVSIAVNPADAEATRAFARSLAETAETWAHVRLVEEAEISPGGCRVSWGSGSMDCTLETQLDRIEQELRSKDEGEGSSRSEK